MAPILFLIFVCSTSSLHARAAMLAARSLPLAAPSAPRRASAALMMSPEADGPAAAYDDDNNPFSSKPRLVDPMTTSLGKEKELEPFPGPPIVEELVRTHDSRPLFVSVNYFTPSHMPSGELQTAYMDWLADGSGDRICLPHYMLSADSFEDVMDTMGELRRRHQRSTARRRTRAPT